MYRSVTQSQQPQNDRRRGLRWAEGIAIGIAVFVVIFFAFGWG